MRRFGKWGNQCATLLLSLLLTITVGALGFASAASAADLPARAPAAYTKAPSIVEAAYDLSGFYIGINGGGGIGNVDWSLDNGGGDEGSHNLSGGAFGGQVGYRWQMMNSWVFGFEAQATGPISRQQRQQYLQPEHEPDDDRFFRSVHRPDRLRLGSCAVLREGRRSGYGQQVHRFRNARWRLA